LLVNELGMPLQFLIAAGQIGDYAPALALLGTRQAEAVIADKGYASDAVVAHVETAMNAKAVIPPRSNRKQQRDYDRALYQLRNPTARCFSKLKHFRRFATRYEKAKACFAALVALACSWIILQLHVDTA
jgi:transposase